jgi:hypothetical protein
MCAFAVHFALSLGVLLPVIALIAWAWYPEPLFTVQGVMRIFGVLVGVHLFLWPFLTFLIFKPGKKGLKFDLVVIAALQVAALAYGTHTIHAERPRYVVFAVDRYEVLARLDVDFRRAGLDGFGEGNERFSYVFAQMPFGEEFQRFQESVLFGGQPDLERRPEYWRPLEGPVIGAVLAAGSPLEAYAGRGEAVLADLERRAGRLDLDPATALVVPVVGKGGDFLGFLDPESARLLDVAPVDPWQER